MCVGEGGGGGTMCVQRSSGIIHNRSLSYSLTTVASTVS